MLHEGCDETLSKKRNNEVSAIVGEGRDLVVERETYDEEEIIV